MNVEAIQAGATVKFNIPGRNFRLIETTGPVNITFYRRGAEIAESVQVEAGYSEKWEESSEGFEQVEFYSATAQTIKFAVRMESSVSYDRAVGNVAVTNVNPSSWLQASRAVSSSGFSDTLSARARSYLLVQNRHLTAELYVYIGTGGTTSTAIKLDPGDSFEVSGIGCPSSVIRMYSPVSHNEVVTVEGLI
jgi:hypothetical protein